MGRMTITIDDDLVEETRRALGVSTKSEAIRTALKELLRRKRLEEASKHKGSIDLDVDQDKLKTLRNKK